MAGPTPSASLVLNEVIHLLAGPSPSANPAEPNPEVVIVWMKSESIGCTKSKCSPAQSSDKVNVIQVKWWIFWLCQAQMPVRLNQVLKWMIKLLLSKWIDGGSCWYKPRRPAWINEKMNDVAVPTASLSLIESNGKITNVWMKRWIFWRCQI